MQRVTKVQAVNVCGIPINAVRRQEIVERRGSKTSVDGARRRVSRADQHRAILIPIFKRAEEPCLILLERPAERERVLLAIKGRRRAEIAVECRWQALQLPVAKIE